MAWRKSGLSHTAEEILVMTCEGRGAEAPLPIATLL